jgi:hypothetical protein
MADLYFGLHPRADEIVVASSDLRPIFSEDREALDESATEAAAIGAAASHGAGSLQ